MTRLKESQSVVVSPSVLIQLSSDLGNIHWVLAVDFTEDE